MPYWIEGTTSSLPDLTVKQGDCPSPLTVDIGVFEKAFNDGVKCLEDINPEFANRMQSGIWLEYEITCDSNLDTAAVIDGKTSSTAWFHGRSNPFSWAYKLRNGPSSGIAQIRWRAGEVISAYLLFHEMLHALTGLTHEFKAGNQHDPDDQIYGCTKTCFLHPVQGNLATKSTCATCAGPKVAACNSLCDKYTDDCNDPLGVYKCPGCSPGSGFYKAHQDCVNECETSLFCFWNICSAPVSSKACERSCP